MKAVYENWTMMTPTVESILIALHEMKPPAGSSIATRFEKTAEQYYSRALWSGLAVFAVALLVVLAISFFDLQSVLWVQAVRYLFLGAVGLVVAGSFFGLAGMVHGIATMHRFVHLYFLECVRTDTAHAHALRTFGIEELKTAKEILDLQIKRLRDRLVLFAGAPEKVSLFAVVAVAWAAYLALSPFLSARMFDIASPKGWGAWAAVIVALFLISALAGAMYLNLRVHRLVYQIQLIDIATSSTR